MPDRPSARDRTDGRPQKLTAARLLFGFVGTARSQPADDAILSHGLGVRNQPNGEDRPSDFIHVAGRVRVNHAVEQGAGQDTAQRFLQPGQDFFVPLRPLGSPKPSAVEHYLHQDKDALNQRDDQGITLTYGDAEADASALNGRKFYLHNVRVSSTHTSAFESPGRNDPDADTLATDQASMARFVSREGRQFRFAIRFSSLKPWELGALLFVIDPQPGDLDAIPRLFELVARAEAAGLIA